jgi:plastocyanin
MRPALLAVALLGLVGGAATAGPKPAKTGTITGSVSFKGEAPARDKLRRDSDPFCAKTEALADDVIVAKGKVRDVVVRIKNGTAGTHTAPATPVVLTQSACTYAPHVTTAMPGQALVVKNADATYHNVHGWLAAKTLWNESSPAGSADIEKADVGKAGDVVELKCDVHPWMHAYVVVTDHPFVAVTGDDGSFTIANVPAGKYVVEAWHPTLGTKTAKVTVGKKAAKAAFTFTPVAPDEE